MHVLTIGCTVYILYEVKPYNKEILNKLDGITWHLIIFVAALRLLDDFDSLLLSPWLLCLSVLTPSD